MTQYTVLRDLKNIGYKSPARAFPGFRDAEATLRRRPAPRSGFMLSLRVGDLVLFEPDSRRAMVQLVAFDHTGQNALPRLGLKPDGPLAMAGLDIDEFSGWVLIRGGSLDPAPMSSSISDLDGALILKAECDMDVWVFRPVSVTNLVYGDVDDGMDISHKPAAGQKTPLPPLLGDVRDEFTIPSGTAKAYQLQPGEILQIIDVEGQQCSDFTAFRTDGLDQGRELMIDSTATRSMVRRAYPTPGLFDKFFDQEMRPLLNVVQDTCGRHDTFGLACTARGYEERGFMGHVNCSDNISQASASYGVKPRSAWPAINFFWNTWIDHNSHHLQTAESYSRPGDYVAMRAMDDLVCVSTACPDDIDPINGWNPTDVHVRIYKPQTPLRRAIAYRETEDAPISMSTHSAFHPRLESLTQNFAPARDLWTPTHFSATGALGEYWACREAVTLQDMSGLRKYDIVGPDAEDLLQIATTRNVAKLAVWRGTYTLLCDDIGQVIDDGTLFRLGPDLFRWCCGTEESGRVLQSLADTLGLQVRIHHMGGNMPNLALQGPKSRDVLRDIVFTQPHVPDLDNLKWFGATMARLYDREGAPFMLTRSGYTGELGYEIFCSKADALTIWDAVMQAGAPYGITPMGGDALEMIRIEAGLAAANAEFAPGADAFEAGLGFAVDMKKDAFTGKSALERNAASPRRLLKGLKFGSNDAPHHGQPVFDGERQVGVITSATRSPSLGHAIAMARIGVEYAESGQILEVGQLDGRMKRLTATVCDIPFIDPQRKRARA